MKKSKGRKERKRPALVLDQITKHFGRLPLSDLITASRQFPISSRIDVQDAVRKLFEAEYESRLLGIHRMYGHSTLTFPDLLNTTHDPVLVGPLQHSEIDIGETLPARCLRQGLWLGKSKSGPFAMLLTEVERYGRDGGTHLEIAVPPGEENA